jgi:hypothetical protein
MSSFSPAGLIVSKLDSDFFAVESKSYLNSPAICLSVAPAGRETTSSSKNKWKFLASDEPRMEFVLLADEALAAYPLQHSVGKKRNCFPYERPEPSVMLNDVGRKIAISLIDLGLTVLNGAIA